ncbi:MAG TPA: J domain-containing protein, partial [Candidatus Babeliales bacterium]|nr:J domain-containing protein [Candidatus Babeliales bacterium]
NGPLKNIAADNALSDDTNVSDISVLNIYYCPQKNCGNNKDQLQVTFDQVEPDTTLYVKFDIKNGKGVLEPQKGDWSGKSTEGYSLRKNIKVIKQQIVKSSGEATSSTNRPRSQGFTKPTVSSEEPNKPTPEPDIQAEAWSQFPEANKLRKAKVPASYFNQYDLYPKDIWFKVLDASPATPKSDLKVKYRKLALKWHPDRNMDKRELAKEVLQILATANEQVIEGAKVFTPRND